MTVTSLMLPADRARALTNGFLWLMPAALAAAVALLIYPRLRFVPSGVSNRLEDYGIATLSLPIPLFSIFAGFKSMRWVLLGCWPRPVGVVASPLGLEFRLGPVRRFYEAARFEVLYPFQLLERTGEAPFEAYLPEEAQKRQFLPRITHPQAQEPLNRSILRYVSGDEMEAAKRLRPIIELWLSARNTGVPADFDLEFAHGFRRVP